MLDVVTVSYLTSPCFGRIPVFGALLSSSVAFGAPMTGHVVLVSPADGCTNPSVSVFGKIGFDFVLFSFLRSLCQSW